MACLLVAALVAGCGETDRGIDNQSPTDWPLVGRIPARTHSLSPKLALDPPLLEAWSLDTHAPIEFPPVIAESVAYVTNLFGNASAIRLSDRKLLWRQVRNSSEAYPRVDATAPAYHDGRVFLALQVGELIASDASTGEPAWTRDYSHLEFSPLALRGTVYIGANERSLIALRASDGAIRWRFHAPEEIGASPSYRRGRLYFPVEASMYCLDASSGKVLWRSDTSRVRPRTTGVDFSSSPAIAFGHVYAARSDGRVFALSQGTGKVEWSFLTGDIIVGAPATAELPSTPPTVYIGSYDEHFYALNGLTGELEWKLAVGGPVLGTATVIGHTVYSSQSSPMKTIGIDVRTHRRVVELPDISYPPVSDGRSLYVVDGPDLIGLRPGR